MCIPGAEAPRGVDVWPPEPRGEPEPYTTARDPAAYAAQAIADAYRRNRGPMVMREAGRLLVRHGDGARCAGRAEGVGRDVDELLESAGVPYAPQMGLL